MLSPNEQFTIENLMFLEASFIHSLEYSISLSSYIILSRISSAILLSNLYSELDHYSKSSSIVIFDICVSSGSMSRTIGVLGVIGVVAGIGVIGVAGVIGVFGVFGSSRTGMPSLSR